VGGIARGGMELAGCGGKLLRKGVGREWGGEEIVGVSGLCSGRGGILQGVCSTLARVQMREFSGFGEYFRGWGNLQRVEVFSGCWGEFAGGSGSFQMVEEFSGDRGVCRVWGSFQGMEEFSVGGAWGGPSGC